MKDYKYGTDEAKDKKVDEAIEKYKAVIWIKPGCEVCDTTTNVRYDNETSKFICDLCLTKELREDIEGLVDVGILK